MNLTPTSSLLMKALNDPPPLYTILSLLHETNPEIKKQLETHFSEYLNKDPIIAVPKSCLTYSNGIYHLTMRDVQFSTYNIWSTEPQTKRKILEQLGRMLHLQEGPFVLIPITTTTQNNLIALKNKHELNKTERAERIIRVGKSNPFNLFEALEGSSLFTNISCGIESPIQFSDSDLIALTFTAEIRETFKKRAFFDGNAKDIHKIPWNCIIEKLSCFGKIKKLSEKQIDMTFNFK